MDGVSTNDRGRGMASPLRAHSNLLRGDFTQLAATEQGHIAHKLLAQQVQRSLDTSLSTRAETV